MTKKELIKRTVNLFSEEETQRLKAKIVKAIIGFDVNENPGHTLTMSLSNREIHCFKLIIKNVIESFGYSTFVLGNTIQINLFDDPNVPF